MQRKKAVIDLLEPLHKEYSGELKAETASYHDILDYFIKLPPKDTAPLAPSFDKDSDNSADQETAESSSSNSEESSDEKSARIP
jgi:hypothetical protein